MKYIALIILLIIGSSILCLKSRIKQNLKTNTEQDKKLEKTTTADKKTQAKSPNNANNSNKSNKVDFRRFKKMFKISEKALRRTNPLDNDDQDDCPAELMVNDWEHFQDTFPLKATACKALWATNHGLPGKKIMNEFNKIDKDFKTESCPTKQEYDEMAKSNTKLLELVQRLMPLTFEKCKGLWDTMTTQNVAPVMVVPNYEKHKRDIKPYDDMLKELNETRNNYENTKPKTLKQDNPKQKENKDSLIKIPPMPDLNVNFNASVDSYLNKGKDKPQNKPVEVQTPVQVEQAEKLEKVEEVQVEQPKSQQLKQGEATTSSNNEVVIGYNFVKKK